MNTISVNERDKPVVLVVDDDSAVRMLMRTSLEQAGYIVVEAENGQAALGRIEANIPALIVSDALMPELNGFALCSTVRGNPQWQCVPFLIMTASEDRASIEEAFKSGATDFITKPINWTLIAYRIRYLLHASQTAAALREAKTAAELANTAKTNFLTNMSHELRTPLNGIIGFSDMIMSQAMGPVGSKKYLDYAKDIKQSGTHLLSIVNDILDLSKASAGKVKLIDEVVDVPELVLSAVRMMWPWSESAGVLLTHSCQDELPKLYGDRLKLKQVLLNLLSNAVKFTPPNGKVNVIAGRNADDELIITVSDTGIGMDETKIPAAFEPFIQLDDGLGRRYNGTGLGLPLAAAMMALHGGKLTLQSRQGFGTTATMWLPKTRVMSPAAAAAD